MKDLNQLVNQLKQLLTLFKRYAITLAIIGFALLGGYILTLTARLSAAEPSESAAAEQAEAVPRPQVDPTTVDTILGLEDRNVQVRSIFEEARENPFTE